MIKVLTYGTFDLLHYGHINLLKRAKALGNYLIVGVSSDEFNMTKNKQCTYSLTERCQIISSIRYVDQVIVESSWEQKIKDIQKYQIDIFVMGDDWRGKFDFLNHYCQVIYLPRTEGISTTMIKTVLKNSS